VWKCNQGRRQLKNTITAKCSELIAASLATAPSGFKDEMANQLCDLIIERGLLRPHKPEKILTELFNNENY
jgi:hypothetical protein